MLTKEFYVSFIFGEGSLAATETVRIAHQDECTSGTRQQHIDPLVLVQEPDLPCSVAANEGGQDDANLLSLEVVHS